MIQNGGVFQLGDDGWIALPDTTLSAGLTEFEGPLTMEMATQDDFHLLRIIGNLKISGRDETYFEFKENPALLQVRVRDDDLVRANNRRKALVLAYWWAGRWVPFEAGSIPANPDAGGEGWRYFVITEMPDPAIAWGT